MKTKLTDKDIKKLKATKDKIVKSSKIVKK